MLICINPQCQSANPEGSNYCGKCGTRLPSKKIVLETTQFCRVCGTRRERYPNDRRMCTVLFADVHGYTAMSETLNDVEKVTHIMNDVFTRLTEKIVDLGGSIDKYAGDNIMARFGAPEAHEDDPERAVRAALGMQAELKKISRELQAQYGFGLDMRIGLNTGEVNAAEVGGEVRGISYKTYTIMGDTVNLASRLEHESRIGHILVGELTYRLSQHAFEFIDMGFKQIRGKKEPVHCYEVVGPKQERINRRGLAGRDLPLIGRDAEMAQLWERLQNVLEGHGQVVAVLGEAGVGKSSLLREFKRRINAFDPDIWYLDGAAFSYSSGRYFSLMRTVLFKYCKISDNEEEIGIRTKLLRAVRELTEESNEPDATQFGEYAALLGQIAGIRLPNTFIDGLDPQKRNNLLIEAMSDFLLKKADTNPLVLVLDDLHWADSNSLEVIDRIIAKVSVEGRNPQARNREVMLLLLYRPEFSRWPTPSSLPATTYQLIRLERLQPDRMELLVRQFLEEWLKAQEPHHHDRPDYSAVPVPTPVMNVIERAGGNAFFAEEILKRLLEDGHLVPDDEAEDGWRIEGNFQNFTPPETLQEILLARVDNLDIYDKRVLQIGSVIGNRFESRILMAVDDLSGDTEIAQQALTVLQRKDLIRLESRIELEYIFQHYLTREVAYNNLLGVERSRYHGQVAQAIELYKSDRLQDYTIVDDLAYHYEHSTNEEKAVQYLLLAGNMRQGLFRNDEALSAFYDAQDILQGAEFRDQPQTNGRLVEIDTNIGDILALKEDYEQAITHYNSALERCQEPLTRVRLYARLIEVLGKSGNYEGALQAYEQARQEFNLITSPNLKTDHEVQHLRAKLLIQVGWIYYLQGRYDDALTAYQVSLSLLDNGDLENHELQIDRSRAYSSLGTIYTQKSDINAAEENLQKAVELQKSISKLDSLGRTYNTLGWIAMLKGDLVKAEFYLKQCRDNAQRSGDVQTAAASLGGLGIIAARQGRLEQALRYYRSLENSPNPAHVATAHLNIGQVLIQEGRYEEAINEFDKTIKMGVALGAPAIITESYNNMGAAYRALRNWSDAERWLEAGLARAQELNSLELTAYARLYRTELYLDQLQPELAEPELTVAEQLGYELGDPLVVGQLERLKGRLAFLQGDYNKASQAFEKSLTSLEPIKAFLEMSYTKLYFARTLLATYQYSQDLEALERTRALLMQSYTTFEACDAEASKLEAEQLLRELGEPLPA